MPFWCEGSDQQYCFIRREGDTTPTTLKDLKFAVEDWVQDERLVGKLP
jgi:hypothetical protein